METLSVKDNETIFLREIPGFIEPAFCGKCGSRVAWIYTGFTDTPVLFCDSCMAERREPWKDD